MTCYDVLNRPLLLVAPPGGCVVSKWGEWGTCQPSKACGEQGTSWSEPAETWDTGRLKMAYIMQQKVDEQKQNDLNK